MRFANGTVELAEPEHESDFEVNMSEVEANLNRIIEDAWELFPTKSYMIDFDRLMSIAAGSTDLPPGLRTLASIFGVHMLELTGLSEGQTEVVERILTSGLERPIQIRQTSDGDLEITNDERKRCNQLLMARVSNPTRFAAQFRNDQIECFVGETVAAEAENMVNVG